MAGMLPGVEAARRRRFHNSKLMSYGGSEPSPTSSTRRSSSFCLYATTHEFQSKPYNSMRNPISQVQGVCDESRLGEAAREAKKRLDRRLQPQRRSETKRVELRPSSDQQQQISRYIENRPIVQSDVQVEMPKSKKSGLKRPNWLKLSWKSSEQEECAVCLERFKGTGRASETLMQLPCAHKFHSKCLLPWLEANAHCPCCRMEISS